jgi:hypothetical protein
VFTWRYENNVEILLTLLCPMRCEFRHFCLPCFLIDLSASVSSLEGVGVVLYLVLLCVSYISELFPLLSPKLFTYYSMNHAAQ